MAILKKEFKSYLSNEKNFDAPNFLKLNLIKFVIIFKSMNQFYILFILFSMLFCQYTCIKIGFLDDTSPSGSNSRINDAFDKYYAVANAYGSALDSKKFSYNYESDDFLAVWKAVENNETGVDVVVSSCNFLINDNSIDKYSIVGESAITLWCGCEDFLSICIKNMFFYSSSKAVIYRCM